MRKKLSEFEDHELEAELRKRRMGRQVSDVLDFISSKADKVTDIAYQSGEPTEYRIEGEWYPRYEYSPETIVTITIVEASK
jgi:hypothetical protein